MTCGMSRPEQCGRALWLLPVSGQRTASCTCAATSCAGQVYHSRVCTLWVSSERSPLEAVFRRLEGVCMSLCPTSRSESRWHASWRWVDWHCAQINFLVAWCVRAACVVKGVTGWLLAQAWVGSLCASSEVVACGAIPARTCSCTCWHAVPYAVSQLAISAPCCTVRGLTVGHLSPMLRRDLLAPLQ
jgi:hypothetical protein